MSRCARRRRPRWAARRQHRHVVSIDHFRLCLSAAAAAVDRRGTDQSTPRESGRLHTAAGAKRRNTRVAAATTTTTSRLRARTAWRRRRRRRRWWWRGVSASPRWQALPQYVVRRLRFASDGAGDAGGGHFEDGRRVMSGPEVGESLGRPLPRTYSPADEKMLLQISGMRRPPATPARPITSLRQKSAQWAAWRGARRAPSGARPEHVGARRRSESRRVHFVTEFISRKASGTDTLRVDDKHPVDEGHSSAAHHRRPLDLLPYRLARLLP